MECWSIIRNTTRAELWLRNTIGSTYLDLAAYVDAELERNPLLERSEAPEDGSAKVPDEAGELPGEETGNEQEETDWPVKVSGPFVMQHLHGLSKVLLTDLAKDNTEHDASDGVARTAQQQKRGQRPRVSWRHPASVRVQHNLQVGITHDKVGLDPLGFANDLDILETRQ